MSRDTDLVSGLDMDARQSAALRRALEDEFGVPIPKDDARHLMTVGDLTRYIHDHAAQGPA